MNFFINAILNNKTVDEQNNESDRQNSSRVLIEK